MKCLMSNVLMYCVYYVLKKRIAYTIQSDFFNTCSRIYGK